MQIYIQIAKKSLKKLIKTTFLSDFITKEVYLGGGKIAMAYDLGMNINDYPH